MKKLKLLLMFYVTMFGGVSASALDAPTASTPVGGNVYYLYNPITQKFLSLDGKTPYVRTTGLAWKFEASDTEGYYTLRVNNETDGYLWGKWWANYAGNYADYPSEARFKLVEKEAGSTYKLHSGGWDGTDNAYVYLNYDRVACNSQEQNGLDEAYTIWQFVTEADYVVFISEQFSAGSDATAFINNWDFINCVNNDFPGWKISAPNGGNTQKLGDTAVEYWIGTAASGNFDYYQTLTGLPEGRYTISASMFNSTNDAGGVVNGNVGVYGTSNGVTSFEGITADDGNQAYYRTYSTGIFVNNGELRLGVKNNGTMGARWFGVDWIKLNYVGKVVQDYAVALPDGGAMTADTWYYFDIHAATNYNADATTLGDIICTTDGNRLLTDASAGNVTLAATGNALTAQRYYVKSSSNNNLVVAPDTHTYNVSQATADIEYIQPGNIVTVDFAVSTSNDAATLKQDYSGVTFNGSAIICTSTANGFTFTVPESLTAATDNNILYIPAEAIGYEVGNTYNTEQSITLKAPAIFDGVYYLYNTDTKTYLSRAGKYNTQAVLDNWGLALNVSTDGNNNTKLQYFDSQLWLGFDGWCYGDTKGNDVRTFNISKVEGGYKLLNTNNSKYLAVNSGAAVADAVEGDNLVGTSNIWALESTTAHVANYTKNANDQVATAVASTDFLKTFTTKAALDSELESNYIATPITITGKKEEKFNKYPGNGENSGSLTYYSETVTDLEPGLYKLSVDAFQRAAGYNRVAAADGARSIIYLYAGNAKTQLKSVMEYGADDAYTEGDNPNYEYNGKNYPNSEAAAYTAFETGKYSNDVYVYVAADEGKETGTLEIGIKNPTRLGGDFSTWAVYDNWTLTRYDKKPFTASFVNGEKWDKVYAYVWNGTNEELNGGYPGKEIPKTSTVTDNADTYDVYTYSYVGLTAPEHIIFSDGTDSKKTGDLNFVDGMLNTDKVAFVPVYAVVGSKKGDDTDRAIFSSGWDVATQTDILTENEGVYTKTYSNQPLDAQTIAFKVIKKNYVEAESEITGAWYPTNNVEIEIPVKGVYDITIKYTSETNVTGESKKISEAVTIGEKGWATTVTNSPLDFSASGVEAYTAKVENNTVQLTKVDDVQAETGLVLKGAKEAKTYYIPVIENSTTDKGDLKHSSTDTYNVWQPSDGTVNTFYGLTVNTQDEAQFVKINAENGYPLPAGKAFLLVNTPSGGVRELKVVYADEANGIDAIVAEKSVEGIYNMNGQRVAAPAKGLYIVNGKKVIMK